jgi:NADH pyrophosphatase NudC (nudix superfamily)
MMALVWRPGEVLLARAPHFVKGMYSALAGFVEAGESLEECVHREVLEEVGVQVDDLRYYGSQSWPFPHSLMVAFTAAGPAATSCRRPARSNTPRGSRSTRCRTSRRASRSPAT